jgi:hypothetical protein
MDTAAFVVGNCEERGLYHIFEMQKKENFQFYLKDVIV